MIDWKTTAFQIVNFLILLWLLKRFLFGRIVEAMDKREADIAATIKDAEDREAEARRQADEMARKNQEFDAQRDDMLAKAKADADAHRKELTAQAREEVERTRSRWHEAVEREKEAFLADLRQRATAQTCAIARRALADLATVGLEGQILDAFVGKVETLDGAERARFAASIQGTEEEAGRVVVRSAFELPAAARERLVAAIQAHIGKDLDVQFDASPDLICGIELAAAGTKLAWTVEDYLATLEENLAEALGETGPSPEEAPAAEPTPDRPAKTEVAESPPKEPGEAQTTEERRQEQELAVEAALDEDREPKLDLRPQAPAATQGKAPEAKPRRTRRTTKKKAKAKTKTKKTTRSKTRKAR